MIKAIEVSKTVTTSEGSLTILADINFSIESGESVAIVGASGSGKTTLLGLLAGLDMASGGTIWINDHNLCAMDEEARALLRAQSIGFIFQSFQLIPAFTALENTLLPLEINDQKGTNHKALAMAILKQVGLEHRLHHTPGQLSGGEQQRVAIARAFIRKPALLFADEPTGNLDQKTGHKITQLLFELNERHGSTLIMVTHDPQLAQQCQRRLLLDNGRLIN